MLELPESFSLMKQLDQSIKGKTIAEVVVNTSPHSFAWFFGDPNNYHARLAGKKIDSATAYAAQLEIKVEDMRILFSDGVNIRFFNSGEKLPTKHQLLIKFQDSTCLVCSVLMYGGLLVFKDGEYDNPYYLVAKEKPSPLSDEFNISYFCSLLTPDKTKTLSSKAFLATEQRIPGLGNGVLQDILYNARIHPKRKMNTLSKEELESLYNSVKSTLLNMINGGGRDTEKDIFGSYGGYKTLLSKNTVGKPCKCCGNPIKKEAYLGGSIYYCEHCQPYIKA
jgi:formamidopyrimidine-DNA glycosylase